MPLQTSVVPDSFKNFREFYPFYLGEHSNVTCRRLHVVGTALSVSTLALAILSRSWWLLPAAPVIGYGFAWVGHFVYEKNRPATFRNPLYSLLGDFVMARDVLIGRIRW